MHLEGEDYDLWKQLKNGERSALDALYHQYFKLLYNYGRHLVSDITLVEDCIQDLFVTIWASRKRLGNVNSPKHYLLSSFRRKLLKEAGKRKKLRQLEDFQQQQRFLIEHSAEFDLIMQQADTEQKARLLAAMNALSDQQKEALFLKFYNNLSYQEVAAVMSAKTDTIYKIIARALKLLKKTMSNMNSFLLFTSFF